MGLADRPSRPQRSPGASRREVISKVLYLRQTYYFGPGNIADYLNGFISRRSRRPRCIASCSGAA